MQICFTAVESTMNWSTWVNSYHNLETRISQIAKKNIFKLDEPEIADLKQGLNVAYKWTFQAGRMKHLLSSLPKETVQALMFDLMATANEKEINYYFEKILKLYLSIFVFI